MGACDRVELGKRLSDAAGSFLERSWADTDLRSKRFRKYLPGIVRLYIQCAEDPFDLLTELRKRLAEFSSRQQELLKKTLDSQELAEGKTDADDRKDPESKGWGSLTAHTFHVYCNSVFEQYVKLFKAFKPANFENTENAFSILQDYLIGLHPLYELARNEDKVIGTAMRSGRLIVDQFITFFPFLKEKFGNYRKLVVRTLKLQQKSTRLLQVFCAHSKSMPDKSLTSIVPQLRKTLETLLYRVKELMESQNSVKAYTLGNLKHRNISGEVVGSQEQYKSESEYSTSGSESRRGCRR